jgi:hypothetical protein
LIRNVTLIVEGFYRHPDSSSTMVSRTSGAPVHSLNLRQDGDQLEAFDNNGIVFRGTIGQVVENARATFTLDGSATSGEPATLSGTISVEGTTATMRGSWIEPNVLGTVYAVASVPSNAPPAAPTNDVVTLDKTLATLAVGDSTTFNASGGTGQYSWRVSNASLGGITDVSGSGGRTATYAANAEGVNTVTATDSSGESASAEVRQVARTGGNGAPPAPG